MIDALWSHLRAAFSSYDELIEFLETKLADARVERAQVLSRLRMSPEYDGKERAA